MLEIIEPPLRNQLSYKIDDNIKNPSIEETNYRRVGYKTVTKIQPLHKNNQQEFVAK